MCCVEIVMCQNVRARSNGSFSLRAEHIRRAGKSSNLRVRFIYAKQLMASRPEFFEFNLSELGNDNLEFGGKVTLSEVMRAVAEDIIEKLKNGDVFLLAITASTLIVTSIFVYSYFYSTSSAGCPAGYGSSTSSTAPKKKEEEEPIVLRDFTLEQLREFDGTGDKKIFVSLKGEVYDVTAAAAMYGPEGSYHCFAGREASVAMAKLSFDEVDLANTNYHELSPFEKSSLSDWIDKFKWYKGYPVVGRVSVPPADLVLTLEALADFKGQGEVPAGRVDAPMYIGVLGDVFDVSYGGKEMYSAPSPYVCFLGIDASRALAKLSFKPEDLSSRDLADLSDTERKTLQDWHTKYANARKYPIVGKISA